MYLHVIVLINNDDMISFNIQTLRYEPPPNHSQIPLRLKNQAHLSIKSAICKLFNNSMYTAHSMYKKVLNTKDKKNLGFESIAWNRMGLNRPLKADIYMFIVSIIRFCIVKEGAV